MCDGCFAGTPPPAAKAALQLLVPKVLRPPEPSNADRAEDLVSPMASPASKQQKRIEKKRHTDRVDQFVADMILDSVLQPEEGDDNALDNVTIGEASDYSRPWDFLHACRND